MMRTDLWRRQDREVKEFGVKIKRGTAFQMNSGKRGKMEAGVDRDKDLIAIRMVKWWGKKRESSDRKDVLRWCGGVLVSGKGAAGVTPLRSC